MELSTIHKMAKCIAIKMGFSELADDLAQDVILYLLEGRDPNTAIKFMIIDAWRMKYRKHNIIGKDPDKIASKYLSLREMQEVVESRKTKSFFNRMKDSKYPEYFDMSLMGYKNAEIAREFGISAPGVSAILSGLYGLKEKFK